MALNNKVHVTPSKFAMWRTAVSLAHCDGRVSNSETALIYQYWARFDFTDDQMRQLEDDFRDGVNFDDVYPLITDKLDRAHLINFAMILFWIDDDYSELEKKMWDVLNARHKASVNYKQAFQDAREATMDYVEGERLKRAREREAAGPLMKATLYLVDASMENEDFEKTKW